MLAVCCRSMSPPVEWRRRYGGGGRRLSSWLAVAVYGGVGGWVGGVVVTMVIRAFLFAHLFARGGHPPSQQLWWRCSCVCVFVCSYVRVFVCSCAFVCSCVRSCVHVRSLPSLPPSIYIYIYIYLYLYFNRAAHPWPAGCVCV